LSATVIAMENLPRRLGVWCGALGIALAAMPFALAQQAPRNFIIHDGPDAVVAISFEDDQGQARSLADFRGKVVLLNVWATWCVPCRKEMPALMRLHTALSDADFAVVAVAVDRAGIAPVRAFLGELGLQSLPIYLDGSGRLVSSVRTIGLPTSLVIDRQGHEFGRIVGPVDWDAPETIAFLRRAGK
jgi:thiol-disulfide isomerase/thioredoxin